MKDWIALTESLRNAIPDLSALSDDGPALTHDAPELLWDLCIPYIRARWVYLIEEIETTRLKIGRSRQVDERLHTLQIATAGHLHLIAQLPEWVITERELQSRFSRHHRRGEWFERPDDLEVVLGELCERWRQLNPRISRIVSVAVSFAARHSTRPGRGIAVFERSRTTLLAQIERERASAERDALRKLRRRKLEEAQDKPCPVCGRDGLHVYRRVELMPYGVEFLCSQCISWIRQVQRPGGLEVERRRLSRWERFESSSSASEPNATTTNSVVL